MFQSSVSLTVWIVALIVVCVRDLEFVSLLRTGRRRPLSFLSETCCGAVVVGLLFLEEHNNTMPRASPSFIRETRAGLSLPCSSLSPNTTLQLLRISKRPEPIPSSSSSVRSPRPSPTQTNPKESHSSSFNVCAPPGLAFACWCCSWRWR